MHNKIIHKILFIYIYLFRILIGFILCLEFWTLGKTQYKQHVKHVSMMSPREGT